MRQFPPLIITILISSLVLTISRAATFPFMTIYLTQHFQLQPDEVGLILSISLTLAITTSLYSGYLVDKFNHNTLILAAITLFALCFYILPWLNFLWGFMLFLALLHGAHNILSITFKACFASWLPVDKRIRAFSANYTLINVGWAVGPGLGVVFAQYNAFAPFLFSGVLSTGVFIVLSVWFHFHPQQSPITPTEEAPNNFRATLQVLRADRKLIYFTLGAVMTAVVFSQFSSYLSQYLITIADADYAYRVIGSTITLNALMVVTLQYPLTSRINPQHLMRWLVIGTAFFIFGLIGFMHANSMPAWLFAMALFTLGEVILIPVEYLFIDLIAPDHLKGSYYGMQNFSQVGGAFNPVMCGLLLTYTAPQTLFYVLIAALLLGLWFFYSGCRPENKSRPAEIS